MHSNLHDPYTPKNYKHKIQPTLYTIPKWILVFAWGRFLQISVLKSLPKPTLKKNSLQKHKILVLFKGNGPISSDLNAATHCQNNKTNKKTKRKSPIKRSSRNPSIRVVVYNRWMHIWITQTSKSKVRMIKLIIIDYLLKQIGFCDKTLKLSLWLFVPEKLMRETLLLCKAHLVPYILSNLH